MQDYGSSKMLNGKTIMFFFLFTIIAFLPISSFLFFIKNDAFSGYFPPKFFMSESLSDGILPLWNPYINFGLPQYGDMSSGFWSPVTWLISITVGYNAFSFTIEVLFYLFIAGVGMYVLCRQYKLYNFICIVAGLSYTCSGYMIGHLQHFNWISGAALLPWALWSYSKLLYRCNLKIILIAALIFYLLISSAHPGITIGAIYFFAGYVVHYLFTEKQMSLQKKISFLFKINISFIIFLLLFAAGLIVGYADIIPHFTRVVKPLISDLTSPTNIKSWVSFLFPLATTKNDSWFSTDVSMRNAYMGTTMFLFLIFALVNKKSTTQKFFMISGLFFLLLATGGRISQLFYQLPLIGYVRFPGEYVIFSLFAFIIVAAFALNYFIETKITLPTFSLIVKSTAFILCVLLVWAFIKILTTHNSLAYHFSEVSGTIGIVHKLKMLIDNISFYDAIFLQGLVQVIMVSLIAGILKKGKYSQLILVVAADLILATFFNLPFTGVGQTNVKDVQQVLNKSPQGITIPPLQSINANDTGNIIETALTGNWSFYSKTPGVTKQVPYPILLNNTAAIFSPANNIYFSKPLIFTVNEKSLVNIQKYTGKKLKFEVVMRNLDTVVFQQTYYPHWKVFVDNKEIPLISYKQIYLGIVVTPGHHTIEFDFNPKKVITAMGISTGSILLSLIYLLFIWIFPSWQQKRLHP